MSNLFNLKGGEIITNEPKYFKLVDNIHKLKEIVYPEINVKNPLKKLDTTDSSHESNKLLLPIYKTLNGDAVQITLKYIYEEILTGIFVKIEDNKIKEYVEIYNWDIGNKWSDKIKMPPEAKNWFDYAKTKSRITKKKLVIVDEKKKIWSATNCLIRNEKAWGDIDKQYYAGLYELLKATLANRTIGDCIFILNKKDFAILKSDYTQAYNHIYDSSNYPLPELYHNRSFIPVLSQSTLDTFADIPIPTTDDWMVVSPPPDNNPYAGKKENIKWEDKIPTAFFRGKGTGCGTSIQTNPRFKITRLSEEWEKNDSYNRNNSIDHIPFLDAGIISYVFRDKKVMNNPYLTYADPNKLNLKLKERVPITEQNKYKYLINVEGNSAAYRLGYMLGLDSVILHVETKFKVWLEEFLIPDQHYILIKSDLSNLGEKIKWCKMNDSKCKEIAQNARTLFDKIMNKDFIMDYMKNILNNISFKYSLKSGGNISDQYRKYKDERKKIEKVEIKLEDIHSSSILQSKVAIIVPYRNNKFQSRDKQLALFIEYYHSYLPNLDIYVIEQSEDGKKFNRGALLNIGFKIANESSNQPNIFIFHDVDLVSPPEIKKVYSYKSDIPIHIASLWKEKYTFSDFMGGIISFNEKTYKKVNGFPNRFFGWGGEDDAIYNRMVTNDVAIGKIICDQPTEKDINIKEMNHQNTSEIEELTNKNKKFNILNDLKNWKNDGLNTLKYKILDETTIGYKNVKKYTVDVLPTDFSLKGGEIVSRNYYLHIRFSEELENKFRIVKDKLFNYEPLVSSSSFKLTSEGKIVTETMPAHITMSYGPKLEYDSTKDPSIYEIKDSSEINSIYPNFIENFKDQIPDIKYVRVSPFLRAEKIVIKVELESIILTKMIKFFRTTIKSYDETIKEWKHQYDIIKDDIKKRFPQLIRMFGEDQSFDEENPIGTLHITLITLNPDTPEDIILATINYAESELEKVGIKKRDNIEADRVDIKTPITKRFIDIYKY